MNWRQTWHDEPRACELCGLLDDLDDNDLCHTCGGAPHPICDCEICERYWKAIDKGAPVQLAYLAAMA